MTKAPIDSDNMRRLRSYFPSTQRPALYHYTSHNNALSMADGEVWMTRADCLHDQEEIEHGLSILSEALGPHSPFSTIPNAIRKRLMNCYVLSLSQDSNNQYLVTEYARPPEQYWSLGTPISSPEISGIWSPKGTIRTGLTTLKIYMFCLMGP